MFANAPPHATASSSFVTTFNTTGIQRTVVAKVMAVVRGIVITVIVIVRVSVRVRVIAVIVVIVSVGVGVRVILVIVILVMG